ncbi:MAG: polysaccharide deacetylase family protein [Candidatus Electrothrix sp. AUS1_2]|nr:polysaccharide deacetylase family protein [Candidatus Electrothrix sp. AUS1_2]
MFSVIRNNFKRIQPGIYVFLYHSVYKDINSHPLIYEKVGTSIHRFKEHVELFRSRFEVIRACDIKNILRKKSGSIDKPYAVITFDDGFKDSLENGITELNKYNIPATLFICDRCASGHAGLWRFRLFLLLESDKESAIRLLNKKMNWQGFDEHQVVAESKDNFSKKIVISVDELWEEIRGDKEDVDLFANYDLLKTLDRNLYEFGSHTTNHPVLSAISYREAIHEILIGHKAIEEGIGGSINYFSYPFGGKGHWNSETEKILNSKPEWSVFSAYGGVNFRYNKRDIKRIGVLDYSVSNIYKIISRYEP